MQQFVILQMRTMTEYRSEVIVVSDIDVIIQNNIDGS